MESQHQDTEFSAQCSYVFAKCCVPFKIVFTYLLLTLFARKPKDDNDIFLVTL